MRKSVFLVIVWLLILIIAACGANDNQDGQKEFSTHDENGFSSSSQTDLSSNDFPHTQATMDQPARYIFIDVAEEEQHPQGLPIRLEDIFPGFPFAGNQPPQKEPAPQTPAPKQPQKKPQPTPQPTPQPSGNISEIESRVIELTNLERRRNGLQDVQPDQALSGVAREKSNDMQRNQYFSHTSPTYGSPFDMMRDMGVTYNAAGENIAMGQSTPEQVVQAWMNSPGHRKNMLSPNYSHIGVGYNPNGHYWTQMFILK